MEDNIDLGLELRGLKNDKLMTKRLVECQKNEMVGRLKGKMGEDLIAVLNGERQVELGKLEKAKYKFRNFLRRVFRTF